MANIATLSSSELESLKQTIIGIVQEANIDDQKLLDYIDLGFGAIKTKQDQLTAEQQLLRTEFSDFFTKLDVNGNLEADDLSNAIQKALDNATLIAALQTSLSNLSGVVDTTKTLAESNKARLDALNDNTRSDEEILDLSEQKISEVVPALIDESKIEVVSAITGAIKNGAALVVKELTGAYHFGGSIEGITTSAGSAGGVEPVDGGENPLQEA